MNNNFLSLSEDHYPNADHGDIVSGRIHVDDNGDRYLDTEKIATPEAVNFKESDIKDATPVKSTSPIRKQSNESLEDQADDLMNSIKKYGKSQSYVV